ncbi:MAG: phage major tail tube protein [Pseudobacteriovorax sp.]|nr:phage major tail tube protein [Pseudobacteriovorax sp.]
MINQPRSIKGMSLLVDGRGYVGKVREFVRPRIVPIKEDDKAGFMGSRPVYLDFEPMELSYILSEHNTDTMRLMGFFDDYVPLIFRAANTVGSVTEAIEVFARGQIRDVDPGAFKVGELSSVNVIMDVVYYRYQANGEVIEEADIDNQIFIRDGRDLTRDIRRAIEL